MTNHFRFVDGNHPGVVYTGNQDSFDMMRLDGCNPWLVGPGPIVEENEDGSWDMWIEHTIPDPDPNWREDPYWKGYFESEAAYEKQQAEEARERAEYKALIARQSNSESWDD
jgi:hypothetical protein